MTLSTYELLAASGSGGEEDVPRWYIAAAVATSCTLSCLGALSIILSYLLFPSMRAKQGRQLLFYLSWADLFSAIVYFGSLTSAAQTSTTFCKTQALLGIFFPVASFLWTDCVAFFLYRMAPRTKSFLKYHLVCWGVPAILITVVAWADMEGRQGTGDRNDSTGGWCWVKGGGDTADRWLWVLAAGKIVEWPSILIITPLFYFLVQLRVTQQLKHLGFSEEQLGRRESPYLHAGNRRAALSSSEIGTVGSYSTYSSGGGAKSGQRSGNGVSDATQGTVTSPSASERSQAQRMKTGIALNEFARKLKLVPFVFFISRLLGNIHIVMGLLGGSPASVALQVGQGLFDPAQGFLNALIFVGMSADVRVLYAAWFRSHCGPCCPAWCCARRRSTSASEGRPLIDRSEASLPPADEIGLDVSDRSA